MLMCLKKNLTLTAKCGMMGFCFLNSILLWVVQLPDGGHMWCSCAPLCERCASVWQIQLILN